MSEEKKNIGPREETSTEAPVLGQSAPGKVEPVVPDPSPA